MEVETFCEQPPQSAPHPKERTQALPLFRISFAGQSLHLHTTFSIRKVFVLQEILQKALAGIIYVVQPTETVDPVLAQEFNINQNEQLANEEANQNERSVEASGCKIAGGRTRIISEQPYQNPRPQQLHSNHFQMQPGVALPPRLSRCFVIREGMMSIIERNEFPVALSDLCHQVPLLRPLNKRKALGHAQDAESLLGNSLPLLKIFSPLR